MQPLTNYTVFFLDASLHRIFTTLLNISAEESETLIQLQNKLAHNTMISNMLTKEFDPVLEKLWIIAQFGEEAFGSHMIYDILPRIFNRMAII